MLRAKEPTPTPSPSVVFTFQFVVESIKELRGASTLKEHVTNEHGPDGEIYGTQNWFRGQKMEVKDKNVRIGHQPHL
jgi:hypothetical protein